MQRANIDNDDTGMCHIIESIVATAPEPIACLKAERQQESDNREEQQQQGNVSPETVEGEHPDKYADLDIDVQPTIVHPAPIVVQQQQDQEEDDWDALCRQLTTSSVSSPNMLVPVEASSVSSSNMPVPVEASSVSSSNMPIPVEASSVSTPNIPVPVKASEEVSQYAEMQVRRVALRCMYDGHLFDGHAFSFPIEHIARDSFRLARLPFCSLSCTKAYLRNNDYDTTMLVNFINYAAQKYNIKNVATAPSRNRLACYDMECIGMTIEEFRGHTVGKSELRKIDSHLDGRIDVNIFECLAQTTFLPLVVDRRALKQEDYASAVVLANKRKRNKIMPVVSALDALLLSNSERKEAEEEKKNDDNVVVPIQDDVDIPMGV